MIFRGHIGIEESPARKEKPIKNLEGIQNKGGQTKTDMSQHDWRLKELANLPT